MANPQQCGKFFTVKIRDSGAYRLAEHKNIFNCLVFFSARQAFTKYVQVCQNFWFNLTNL